MSSYPTNTIICSQPYSFGEATSIRSAWPAKGGDEQVRSDDVHASSWSRVRLLPSLDILLLPHFVMYHCRLSLESPYSFLYLVVIPVKLCINTMCRAALWLSRAWFEPVFTNYRQTSISKTFSGPHSYAILIAFAIWA